MPARRAAENRPPLLEPEEWRLVQPPATPPEPGELDDVLRPVEPDGTYGAPPLTEPPRVLTAEEIAQAARRAERLAAEARAALERHGLAPPQGGAWPEERGRGDAAPGRP
jgi:nucleotide-binding universal stress UspA family protein